MEQYIGTSRPECDNHPAAPWTVSVPCAARGRRSKAPLSPVIPAASITSLDICPSLHTCGGISPPCWDWIGEANTSARSEHGLVGCLSRGVVAISRRLSRVDQITCCIVDVPPAQLTSSSASSSSRSRLASSSSSRSRTFVASTRVLPSMPAASLSPASCAEPFDCPLPAFRSLAALC